MITVKIEIESQYGDLTAQELAVLAALGTTNPASALPEKDVTPEQGYTDAPAEGFTPGDAKPEPAPEPEKPKRKRRTKAEIEADEKAARESTGAAVLEDLSDPNEAPEVEQPDKIAAQLDADRQAEADAIALEVARAGDYPGVDHEEPTPAEEPKLEATTDPTPADALKRASQLVETDAGSALVKKAMDIVGVERVSLLSTNEQAKQFLDIVNA